jgi:hypothetical protein
MHPTLNHEIARYRQADMIREASRARLAHEASLEADKLQPSFRFNISWRRHATVARVGRPVLGH